MSSSSSSNFLPGGALGAQIDESLRVQGEDGCFHVIESRFVSGMLKCNQVSSPVMRCSKKRVPGTMVPARPHINGFITFLVDTGAAGFGRF
ncbi:hypothetical protein PoB_006704200 [Plakobranchus ocellatus]|uniref:Uncharacterized protein n=1 Tax=Plakobranchus ocellatus TaxID=259542 RepID=A0AAV4D8X9_9GAST|nr:hypothetical protein PoB_006704200 [Plakobranchus ocellatus]